MNFILKILLLLIVTTGFIACKKDKDPIILIPKSEGNERIVFNGIAGTETGPAAGNSVYLDLSEDKTTAVLRAGWDLGFYNGTDFRVILNNTSSGGAKVLDKYDLGMVTAADTIGLTLAVSQMNPQPEDLEFFDDLHGDLNNTAIPAISPIASSNPVIILNRGTGGGIAARPWVKLRVFRNDNGYTIQYAGILETAFKTLDIPKNPDYNFQFISFDKGLLNVEPVKNKWDILWTYSVVEANFGWGPVPYNFSDMIGVNYLAGVQTTEKLYKDGPTANEAYAAFNKDSIASVKMVEGRWTIGSKWRSTQPAIGSKPDRFYIIKDPSGNYYKLKSLSMGAGNDGGTRGKPEFKYALVQ